MSFSQEALVESWIPWVNYIRNPRIEGFFVEFTVIFFKIQPNLNLTTKGDIVKKSLLIAVAAVFMLTGIASTAQAMKCAYPKWKSGGCVEYVTDGTGQPPCAYHEWPRVPCDFVPKAPKTIVLHGIKFDTASSKIKPESYPILEGTLDTVRFYPRRPVIITGHTDSRGDKPYNQKLSEQRAQAVKNYLVQNDVAPWRITTRGAGETQPIAKNYSSRGRAKNRRIEIDFKQR